MIIINNVEIEKHDLLHLINNGKKLEAIKVIKSKSKIGLKDCKDIVDNLAMNPNFYDNQSVEQTAIRNLESIKSNSFKGSHILKNETSHYKNYIFVVLLLVILGLVFMYFSTV